jgi:hypothetical protein
MRNRMHNPMIKCWYIYLQYFQSPEYVGVLFADRTLDHEVCSVCWYNNLIVAFWDFSIFCASTSKSHNSLAHVIEQGPVFNTRHTQTIKFILRLQGSLPFCSRGLSKYLPIVFSNHLSTVDVFDGTSYN